MSIAGHHQKDWVGNNACAAKLIKNGRKPVKKSARERAVVTIFTMANSC
jgi:hypothetical protein